MKRTLSPLQRIASFRVLLALFFTCVLVCHDDNALVGAAQPQPPYSRITLVQYGPKIWYGSCLLYGAAAATTNRSPTDCCDALASYFPDEEEEEEKQNVYSHCLNNIVTVNEQQDGTIPDQQQRQLTILPDEALQFDVVWYQADTVVWNGPPKRYGRDGFFPFKNQPQPTITTTSSAVLHNNNNNNNNTITSTLSPFGGMHRNLMHTVSGSGWRPQKHEPYRLFLLVPPDWFVNIEDLFLVLSDDVCHVQLLNRPLIDQELPVFLYPHYHVLSIRSNCTSFCTKLHMRYPTPHFSGRLSSVWPPPELVAMATTVDRYDDDNTTTTKLNVAMATPASPLLHWHVNTGYPQDVTAVTMVSVLVALWGTYRLYQSVACVARFSV